MSGNWYIWDLRMAVGEEMGTRLTLAALISLVGHGMDKSQYSRLTGGSGHQTQSIPVAIHSSHDPY